MSFTASSFIPLVVILSLPILFKQSLRECVRAVRKYSNLNFSLEHSTSSILSRFSTEFIIVQIPSSGRVKINLIILNYSISSYPNKLPKKKKKKKKTSPQEPGWRIILVVPVQLCPRTPQHSRHCIMGHKL